MVKYTVAMATHLDFHGVFFTVQALRLYQDMADTEIIILDNDPKGAHSADLIGFVRNANGLVVDPNAKGADIAEYKKQMNGQGEIYYYEAQGQTGTSVTRHKLFELASGELVVVMDCHVLLKKDAMKRLKAFWEKADDKMKKNIFTGPLLMDDGTNVCTHFHCEWRSEMWGTWATAWKKDGKYFKAKMNAEGNKLQLHDIMDETKIVFEVNHGWPGHEAALKHLGFVQAGLDPEEPIFEIPAQGLGLFLAAKAHWLGFNPHHKHFGGEECYIHEKYRQAGRKALCLPFMQWNHRFGRPEGPRYPITREGKMRNYVLEFLELGRDLEEIRKHFIDEVKLPPSSWENLIADPINFDPFTGMAPNTAPQVMKPESKSNFGMPLPLDMSSLMSMATEIAVVPRDLNEHFATFMQYGLKSNSVLEIAKRRESTMFWAAALSKRKCTGSCTKQACDCETRLVSFQTEQDSLISMISEVVDRGDGYLREFVNTPWTIGQDLPEVEGEFSTLYIDEKHTYARLSVQLAKYAPQVNKYIFVRGSSQGNAGVTSEDGTQPGLLHAVKQFLKDNPDWYIAYHSEQQYGMTVLSKVADERPEEPIRPWPLSDDKGQACGVGTEISKILEMMGIKSTPTCSCNAMKAKYNQIGPDACEEQIEDILNYMSEQATARNLGHLFVRSAVRLAVQLAIRRARKKIKNGTCS